MLKQSGIFILLIILFHNAFGDNIRFRKITSTQGLSHHTIYAITQDEQGFMWFGTREGLNRFDSRNVKSYYLDTVSLGKSANQVNVLLNHQKSVYVGTNHGLYRYNALQDRLVPYPLESHMPTIHSLSETGDILYVGTAIGLFQIRNGKARILIRGFARALCALSKDRILLAVNERLLILDRTGHIERTFMPPPFPVVKTTNFTVFQIHRDPKGRIWLATSQGLYRYDDQSQRFTQLHFAAKENTESNTVRSIAGSREDFLYIGTENGLYIYDLKTGQTANYSQSFTNNPKTLNDQAVYSTFIGKDGSVWIGTYFGGVNYIPVGKEGFQNMVPSDGNNGLRGKAISQLMEDSLHHIWVATEDGGISIYHPKTDSFEYINKNSHPFYLNSNNVHAIHNDGYGNIWAGTFFGGLHRFNTLDKTTTIYTTNSSDAHSLSNNHVYVVYRDSRGTLLVGTQQGLNQFDYKTGKFSLLAPEILGDKFIYDLIEDKNGDLWICTRQDGIYRYKPASKTMKHYTNAGKDASLLSNQIISVYKDRDQRLWFGTLDGGVCVYNFATDSFQHYTTADGLANNNVYGILEDDAGYIWLSTNLGISKWNPHTRKFINYDTKYGLSTNQFNFKSSLKDSDGIFYFGSINGLCYFNPLKALPDKQEYPLVLTGFQLFNKDVHPASDSSILKQQIAYTRNINLSYNQNVFTLSYMAINYVNPGSTKYAYYLEGFEKQWNYVGNKMSATYTNLSPGNYTFHVRTLDDAGNFTGRKRSLNLHITPPFYRSNLAYAFYTFLLGLIIYLYTRFVRFIHQKRMEIQLAHIEREKTEALTQHRINFFTFVSHEFKTPLTLILASIDKFVNDKGIDPKQHRELSHIRKNASKLFRLIHQLTEFRKIDGDNLSVRFSRSDLVAFVRQIVASFETLAQGKSLGISFDSEIDKLVVFFDGDKFEKILSNILSNAVKHTNEGCISVRLQLTVQNNQKMVNFVVRDTGSGMSATDLKHIFDPFYRSPEHKAITGTGIGMALVNSLVKSLHGSIDASSIPGDGTTISFSLPIYNQLTAQQQEQQHQSVIHTTTPTTTNLPTTAHPKEQARCEQHTLLLVEDNKELLHFLSQHFQESYHVMAATNGATAWKKINKTPPDIVISDVKMPKIDGLELCLKLKQNKQLDHIPIILLSDGQDEQLKVEGLDIGADAYIGKPFNLKELELLVANMVKSRIKLREHVVNLGAFASDSVVNNNRNQDFLAKLSTTLERLYANPAISIEDIAAAMHISRTSLHLHLKRILNKNATELLNEYRLKKALMMLENDIPINEIAYLSGYRDANYFSRVFKKYYQLSPQKYKELHFRKHG